MNEIKVSVFNGRKMVEVEGHVLPFTEKEKAQSSSARNSKADYEKVQLFRSKRKWWLYYGSNSPTGHFKSRREAVKWFNRGGR